MNLDEKIRWFNEEGPNQEGYATLKTRKVAEELRLLQVLGVSSVKEAEDVGASQETLDVLGADL